MTDKGGPNVSEFDEALDSGRTFDEPWQAEAFALTVALHRGNVFSWPEWSEALGGEIAKSAARGEDDYFTCWLNALETLVARKGVASRERLASVAASWREAYRTTPHGQPVVLPFPQR